MMYAGCTCLLFIVPRGINLGIAIKSRTSLVKILLIKFKRVVPLPAIIQL